MRTADPMKLTSLSLESPNIWSEEMALAFPNFCCASVPKFGVDALLDGSLVLGRLEDVREAIKSSSSFFGLEGRSKSKSNADFEKPLINRIKLESILETSHTYHNLS